MKTLKKLRRAYDEIQPVGSEDPERDRALARHEAGLTKSQDKKKRAGDAKPNLTQLARELVSMMGGAAADIDWESPTQDFAAAAGVSASALYTEVCKLVGGRAKDALSREEATELAKLKTTKKERQLNSAEAHRYHELMKIGSKPASDADILPVPIKTSNAVPMPTENDGAQRYAADAHTESPRPGVTYHYADEPKKPKPIKTFLDHVREGKAKATDAKIVEQRGGSEPADHLHRASVYEVQGDRARALDSYRMAASGFRKSAAFAKTTDEAGTAKDGLSKATDGVAACQSRFASQYQHPGTGRVKVCDSASTALRTALERTRAGEQVHVDGKTVRPASAKANDRLDAEQIARLEALLSKAKSTGRTLAAKTYETQLKAARNAKDDTDGPAPVDNPATPAMPDPVPTGDEEVQPGRTCKNCGGLVAYGKTAAGMNWYHTKESDKGLCNKAQAADSNFSKLESKLEKEGESKKEAGGVAYKVGAEKYGKAGMAAKSAAARDDDTEELAQRIKSLVKELKADGTTNMSTRNLKQLVNTRGLRFTNQNHFERAFSEALAKAGVAKFVAMAEEAGRTKAKDSREVQPV